MKHSDLIEQALQEMIAESLGSRLSVLIKYLDDATFTTHQMTLSRRFNSESELHALAFSVPCTLELWKARVGTKIIRVVCEGCVVHGKVHIEWLNIRNIRYKITGTRRIDILPLLK